MNRPQWPHEEIVLKPMEEIRVPKTVTNSNGNSNNNNNNNDNLSKPSSSSLIFERRSRPQKAAAVNCPRCDSTNTKFCYYNNYSLSQPRYFCKTCRRYWTEGGTLRNIPVGGGSRKNKRSSSSSSYSSSSTTVLSQNPRIHHDDQSGQDLNLGFSSTNNFKNNVPQFLQVPNFDATKNTTNITTSALELLTGITSSRSTTTNSFMPIPVPVPAPVPDANSVYNTPSGQLMIPMPEFKIPSLSFSLDGMESSNGGRLLFPFEDVKTNTPASDFPHVGQNKDQNCDSNGFWNGMMGGGPW